MTMTPTSQNNNIPYMGIEERNPRETYVRRRPPTPQDFRGYKLGDRWVDKSAGSAYILTSKQGGVAFWVPMGGGAGAVSTINGVPPVAGNINLTNAGAINIVPGPPGIVNLNVKVDGITIQIIGDQLVAAAAASIFDVDNGANIVPVAGVVQILGSTATFPASGIESHNGGVNQIYLEDRRYLTPFVVDSSAAIGTRGEYSTIQAAINAANLAGGGVVAIRPGTYIENLTLLTDVEIYGVAVDGRLPAGLSQVLVQGNHTFSPAGGFNTFIMRDIAFEAAAGDLFTISPTAGAIALIAAQDCGLTALGGQGIVCNPALGTFAQFSTDYSDCQTSSNCFSCIGAGSSTIILTGGTFNSSTANVFISAGAGTSNFTSNESELSGTIFAVEFGSTTDGATCTNTSIFSFDEAFNFINPASSADLYHCTINSSAVSTNFITGTGNLTHIDTALIGSAINIPVTITEILRDWKPYCRAGVAPGAGVFRGTAAFDSAQFTAVSGFVQLINPPPTTLSFSLTTIGAVIAETADIAIPASQATIVQANFAVINATATLGAGNLGCGAARDLAGVVTIINTFDDIALNEDPALAASDYDLITGAGASTVRVRVLGVAGETLNWKVLVTLVSTP